MKPKKAGFIEFPYAIANSEEWDRLTITQRHIFKDLCFWFVNFHKPIRTISDLWKMYLKGQK